MWIEISDSNNNNIFLTILYFAPINYTSYKKNNLDKNFSSNTLEQGIHNLGSEGYIFFLDDFNVRTTTNQITLLSNNSNPNPYGWMRTMT